MNRTTPHLRLPMQARPIDRRGALASASGEGGVEAAGWWEDLGLPPLPQFPPLPIPLPQLPPLPIPFPGFPSIPMPWLG